MAYRPALIICDVWDTHWCATARLQADDLAPRINEVARELRRTGGVVIHAPSQTEPFYETSPQYVRAQAAAAPLTARRPLPAIDLPQYSACPCEQPCQPPDQAEPWPWPWRRQHGVIEVAAEDFVACENADAINGVIQIVHAAPVALCGLHVDECILERPLYG